jgi:tetratricopeptide (TPR) repeat protein
VSEAGVLEREVRLACRGPSPDDALPLLKRLCEAPGDDDGPLRRALQALDSAKRSEAAEAVLEAQLTREEASLACGGAWGTLWAGRGDGRAGVERAERLLRGSTAKVAYRAAGLLVERLAEAGRGRAVARLVRRCGAWLSGDDFGWGAIGFALYRVDRFREAEKHLAGWRARKGAGAWMVANLGGTLLALGRAGEAFAVFREALSLERDGSSAGHALTVVLGEALDAADGAAMAPVVARARAVERVAGRGEQEFVFLLIEALGEGMKAPGAAIRQTNARERLSKARRAHPTHLDDLGDANLLGLVLRRLAVGRPLAARLWALRERAQVWVASRGRLFKRRVARLMRG